MIVLDTNVISEVMKGPRADPRVRRWVSLLTDRPLTTVINRAEIFAGLVGMPVGRRRDEAAVLAEHAFRDLDAILPLLTQHADAYADIATSRQAAGRPIGIMDALIAAICRVDGANLATRDLDDFQMLGLELINPWDA